MGFCVDDYMMFKAAVQSHLPGFIWLARLGTILPAVSIKAVVRKIFLCAASYLLLSYYRVRRNLPKDNMG